MNTKLLEQIGLSEEQSKAYLCLISSGSLPARKIAFSTGINRSLVYKVLKQLIALELVTETTNSRSVSTFTGLHPSKLHSMVKKKEEDLKNADQALNEVVSTLGAQFNLVCGKPSIHFQEGLDGIKYLYKDILRAGKNIKLIRSPQDNDQPELGKLVIEQIRKQVEKGIHVQAIVPMEMTHDEFIFKRDFENLVERKRIDRKEMDIPAQIIIYGNKVAITSFKDCLITTIIDDAGIKETFEIIFQRLWKSF